MRIKGRSRAAYVAAGSAGVVGVALGVGLAVVAGVAGAPPATAASQGGCSSGATVTATGSGMANAPPNLLTMQIGVQTTASSASAALARNNSEAKSLIDTLEHGGVKAADIQTSNLSINPSYSNGSTPTVTGYQVGDDVSVRVHNLSSAGSLIDSAASKVGNDVRFDGLSFSVSDPSGPSAAARANAVHVALVEAKAMAVAAGSTLGPLCSVTDTASQPPEPQVVAGQAFAKSAAATSAPLQPGQQQFSAQVTATYKLG
ncbi:MAG: SIMPL domain-containing protein [Acidimicrobiales bacterium]